jgi:hypothetical protein
MEKEMKQFLVGSIRRGMKSNITFVPRITLSGKWLEDAGFIIDEKVEVYVRKGKIVIKPVIQVPGSKKEVNKYFKMLIDSPKIQDCIGFSSGMLTR